MDEKLMTNPYYAKAIEYIKNTDLNSLENGKHLIDGEDLFVNIVDSNMKTPQQARLEVHDRYIDIQIPLTPYSGTNTVIYKSAPTPSTINVPINTFLINNTIPDKELKLNAS